MCFDVEIGVRQEYSIEYCEYISEQYLKLVNADVDAFVYGSGRKNRKFKSTMKDLWDIPED